MMIDRTTLLSLAAILVFQLSLTGSSLADPYRQTWRDLTTPPEDTIEAANTRIWLPIDHKSRCRVTIDISDSTGTKVRTLFDALLGEGYYNFWWNKLNDSMAFVPPGEYDYKVVDQCGGKREGKLTAAYRQWERKCKMQLMTEKNLTGVLLQLIEDSALVSAVVNTFDGEVRDRPFSDTLLNSGDHKLLWDPPDSLPPGRYKMTVTVGDYYQTFLVRCAR